MKNFCVYILLLVLFFCSQTLQAQDPFRRIPGMSGGRIGGQAQGTDSLKRRDNLEDSITIRYRALDTSRLTMFDSSVTNFRIWFPIPVDYYYLGNVGSAARPFQFNPRMESGWDPGFHAYDIYKFTNDKIRFFQTTRPYSELGYHIGSQAEGMINLLHTQNISPNWNFAFQYGLINAAGHFKNQNTNHNRYSFNTDYHSKDRRYSLYLILLGNSMQSNENGGIKPYEDYIDNVKSYSVRSAIPVQLGDFVGAGQTFLNTKLNVGNRQRTRGFFLRQQYDLGKKDSIVTDSNVVKLFYPKFRMEYNFQYNAYRYRYYDAQPDTPFYVQNYNFLVTPPANFEIKENWNEMVNDFSLYSFPDDKNPQQFFKAGASIQNLAGYFVDGRRTYYNLFLHGEYRNKTRNKKWDIEAYGKFYLTGYNNADFDLNASLKRYVSREVGYAQVGLQHVNRTPSFIYETASSFSFGQQQSFNKENITRIFGSLENAAYHWRLEGNYYLVSNLTYFREFYKTDQASALFNVLHVNGEKKFKLKRNIYWLARVQLQQRIGDGPVNIPLIYTFHQIGYEGKLGFKNLVLATGIEARYYTPFKADNYAPLQSQFFFQDEVTNRMERPDISAYMQYRIRSFVMYVRAENLNTARFIDGTFGFTKNNFATIYYPYPGFIFRLGIYWSFVN